jgi:hypothetical protein
MAQPHEVHFAARFLSESQFLGKGVIPHVIVMLGHYLSRREVDVELLLGRVEPFSEFVFV